nr:hypothetical protein [Tanacetum cinerariifolium]
MILFKQEEAGIQLNAEQADWKDDTDDESDDQELEAHYMYMAKFQEVSPDTVDSGPIFDTEQEQKIKMMIIMILPLNVNILSNQNLLIKHILLNKIHIIIKRYIDTKSNHELIHYCLKNPPYELDIRDQLNVKAEAVQIILKGIDNDIYLTVDACPNACEMWKAIERLKQGESIIRNLENSHLRMVNHWNRITQEQADWKANTDDDELEDQELEAYYIYMAQLQQVSSDAAESGPIFDDEPLQKNDDDNDLNKERELLASLIEKLKCEIDDSKNRNKFLETSNMALIENLKGEIEDFKNKNKTLESSNNLFKEANNRLSETNNLLYANYKKSEAELARRNSKEYASQMELECAKVREMKDKLSAHQETISILSKQKE